MISLEIRHLIAKKSLISVSTKIETELADLSMNNNNTAGYTTRKGLSTHILGNEKVPLITID